MTPEALDRGNEIVVQLANIEKLLAMEGTNSVGIGSVIQLLLVQQKADRIAALTTARTALQVEFALL